MNEDAYGRISFLYEDFVNDGSKMRAPTVIKFYEMKSAKVQTLSACELACAGMRV